MRLARYPVPFVLAATRLTATPALAGDGYGAPGRKLVLDLRSRP